MRIHEIINESQEENSKRWFNGKTRLSTAEVLAYVRAIHPDEDDFNREDAVIEPSIKRFKFYDLKWLPISEINLRQFHVLDDLVDEYVSMSTPVPPIVYDPIRKRVIDGMHRATAASKRGDDFILALVGR
jgi:hypothetical protein